MFERYTEGARRTIFFSRYEAAQFGSPFIESEHLLLGLLRESKSTLDFILKHHNPEEDLRASILAAARKHEKQSTREDLPLSNENKRILAYAAEETDRLAHKHIGVEHLLLGMLREEKSFAALFLLKRGVALDKVRAGLRSVAPDQDIQQAVPRRAFVVTQFIPNAPQPPQTWLRRLLHRLRIAK
jgi:ATP-dependent Clp protease ATP-binding subunit ClpC